MDREIIIAEIKNFAEGDKKVQAELIEIIINQFSKHRLLLNKYMEEKNILEIKKIAHFLTSTFIFLKLERPLELVAVLRQQTHQFSQIETALKELINTCEEIIEVLKNKSKK